MLVDEICVRITNETVKVLDFKLDGYLVEDLDNAE